MFPDRYFPSRYFPNRYFPPAVSEVVVADNPSTYSLRVGGESRHPVIIINPHARPKKPTTR